MRILRLTYILAVCLSASSMLAAGSIDILLHHPVTSTANITLLVQDLESGKIIDSYRPKNVAPPASVMKLLPIPALDGGRIVGVLLTTAVEAVTRKKLNPKYEGYIHAAGMIALLALMGLILFKDIFVIVKG